MFLLAICLGALGYLIYKLHEWYRNIRIDDFNSKHVFITGTDSGFGKRLALDLDSKGLIVYAGCYTDKGIEELKQEASSRMRVLNLDVTNQQSVIRAKEFVEKDLASGGKKLWAVVNNAGTADNTLVFEFAQLEDYKKVMDINFFGVVAVTEAFLPLIKESRGRIVNLISVMGRSSLMAGPYSCSKHAVEPYSAGLRRSLKPYGVKVSIIEPGFVRTRLVDSAGWGRSIDTTWEKLDKNLKIEYGESYKNSVKSTLMKFAANPPLAAGSKVQDVPDRITLALSTKYPRYRFVYGLDADVVYGPCTYLPEWVLDVYHGIFFHGGPKIAKFNK